MDGREDQSLPCNLRSVSGCTVKWRQIAPRAGRVSWGQDRLAGRLPACGV